jgi:PIN domain nuclease of toxin-antitoxin system
MRALLDTHAFLWWILDDPLLSTRARNFITDSENEIYFSVASAWEIAIKAQLGRLILPDPPNQFIVSQVHDNNFQILPIQIDHTLRLYDLPLYHFDPFDRLMLAQCQLESLSFITADAQISRYEVPIIW